MSLQEQERANIQHFLFSKRDGRAFNNKEEKKHLSALGQSRNETSPASGKHSDENASAATENNSDHLYSDICDRDLHALPTCMPENKFHSPGAVKNEVQDSGDLQVAYNDLYGDNQRSETVANELYACKENVSVDNELYQ